MVVQTTGCQIPNELLHKILTCVIADSVHSVCMSPTDESWNMNIFSTLSSVSFSFKEISTEVAIKAFAITPSDDDGGVLPLISLKLKYLRDLGIGSRDTSKNRYSRRFDDFYDSTLINAYAIYLAVIELRRHAAGASQGLYKNTHESIQNALHMARGACRMIEPKELSVVLMRAVEDELVLVRNGLCIVQAALELDECIDKMGALQNSTDDKDARIRHFIKTRIHQTLERVEASNDILLVSNNHVRPGVKYNICQLPGVATTINKLTVMVLDVDEYDILARAGSLVDDENNDGRGSA